MVTIKKIILLALTAWMIVGCEETKTKEYRYNVSDINIPNFDRSSDCVVIIDSCEYVHMWKRLAHKGNCRFCKERRQKELEELVIKLKEK